ncbi:MAG: hypothetical protein KF760_29565 [Candidatus Eremiobacteraeota bacterium]|nr:hypothetical protein [Candidatus Eremiobacteraeota bacterium]
MRRLRLAFLTGELLVSLTVFVPIILVLIGVFPFAYGMDHKAADFIEAQEIARDELEKMRTLPFQDVVSGSLKVTRGGLELQVERSVTLVPGGNLKRVDLDVRWRGSEHFRLGSYLYKWAP